MEARPYILTFQMTSPLYIMIDMFIVDLKDKTSRLLDEAVRVGLEINAEKSKLIRQINPRNDQGITVNDEQVDDVKSYCT